MNESFTLALMVEKLDYFILDTCQQLEDDFGSRSWQCSMCQKTSLIKGDITLN